jgi:NifU-like protein involved in Fe-S cluster formation
VCVVVFSCLSLFLSANLCGIVNADLCVLLCVCASLLDTQWVKGKTIDECLKITNNDIAKHLCLPPVKLHCSMLAEDAIKAAIYDFKQKKEKRANA